MNAKQYNIQGADCTCGGRGASSRDDHDNQREGSDYGGRGGGVDGGGWRDDYDRRGGYHCRGDDDHRGNDLRLA